MKNWVMMAVLVAVITMSVSAQVREDKVTINGTEHVALRIDMNYDAKLLSTALSDKLKEAGVKAKTFKGLTTATGVQIIEISPDLMDYYFRVGAVDKKHAVLYLSISKGYTNFINPAAVPQVWENGKQFLNNMVVFAARYQMRADAKEKEKAVSAAQKSYDKTVKSFKKQEEALNKSRQEMEAAQTDWNNKKAELEALQLKIKR